VNSSESSALPGVCFGEFSFAVVQMDGHSGILHVRGHAKPIIVPFKKSMRDRFLLSEAEIATPLVIANDVPLFDVRIHQLNRALDCVVKRRIRGRDDRAKTQQNKKSSHKVRPLSARVDRLHHLPGNLVDSPDRDRREFLIDER
jgi:hypothetical protein